MCYLEVLNYFLKVPLISVLFGAIISLLSTLFVQKRAFREAQKERARSDLEKRQMLGYSLFLKLSNILSDYRDLQNHLNGTIKDTNEPYDAGYVLSKLLPPLNIPSNVDFSADEMANIVHFGAVGFFNKLAYVDRRYNSCLEIWRHYREKRMAIRDAPKKSIDHASGVLEAAIDKGSTVELDLVEAKMLISDIVRTTGEGLKEASDRLPELVRVMNEKMDLKMELARDIPPPH